MRYAQGVDQREWELYASAFADGATIELTLLPGETFTVVGFHAFLSGTFDGARLSGQHRLANHRSVVDGEHARAVTEFFATTLEETGSHGEPELLGAAGLYVDRLERSAAGWRIAHRLLVLKSTESRQIEVTPALRDSIVDARDGVLQRADFRGDDGGVALTPEVLIDRAEIEDVLVAYCQAQDQDLWHLWDSVFTVDATLDLPGVTPDPLSPAGHRDLLIEFNTTKVSSQHALSNTMFDIRGDLAVTVTELTALSLHSTDDPSTLRRTSWAGLYIDDFLRTSAGWRIRHRVIVQKNVQIDEVEYPADTLAMIRAGVSHPLLDGWRQP